MSMTDGFPVFTPGIHEPGPPPGDYYKRAVYRSAPSAFDVEVLEPAKIGNAYCYGMRICPITSSAASIRSSMMLTGYVIWRRWEDCLWFQDILEQEYGIKSSEKRKRLSAGKGVKKNGMYIHDCAASFESLPPGPDPKSIAKDVHEHLPRLTKKGTLFRPSQATIGQRHREFSNLIYSLFRPDVPVLIRELRDDRVVRDFFGHWRRDQDIARKTKGKINAISTSHISTYFSSSTASLSSYSDVPRSIPPSPVSPTNRSSISSGSQTAGDHSETASNFSEAEVASVGARSPPSTASSRSTGFPGNGSSANVGDKHLHPSSSTSLPGSRSPGASSQQKLTRPTKHAKPQSPKDRSAFDMEEDFPLFLSSSTREGAPSGKPNILSPRPVRPARGLEALPEDHELGSPHERSATQDRLRPPPTAGRRRSHSASDAANPLRGTPPSTLGTRHRVSADDPDMLARHMQRLSVSIPESTPTSDRDITSRQSPIAPSLISDRPSSIALSTFSFHIGSGRSSPRPTSSTHSRASPTPSDSSAASAEFDLPFTPQTAQGEEWFLRFDAARPDSLYVLDDIVKGKPLPRRPLSPQPPPSPSAGAALRRSFSAGSRRARQPASVPEEDPWPEFDDEFMDVDFYIDRTETEIADLDDQPLSAVDPPHKHSDHLSLGPADTDTDADLPSPPDSPSPSPRALSLHLSHATLGLRASQFQLPSTPAVDSADLVIKAALGAAIVVFRVPRGAPLADVRARLAERFALEGLPLAGFVLADAEGAVASEEEWEAAVGRAGSKVVLRVTPE